MTRLLAVAALAALITGCATPYGMHAQGGMRGMQGPGGMQAQGGKGMGCCMHGMHGKDSAAATPGERHQGMHEGMHAKAEGMHAKGEGMHARAQGKQRMCEGDSAGDEAGAHQH